MATTTLPNSTTAPRRPVPLPPSLSPSPNPSLGPGSRSPGGSSIKDLLAERTRNSPIPLPSPGLSDSGFSTFESPMTMHSPTFNFAQHHQFDDPIEDDSAPTSFLRVEDDDDDDDDDDDTPLAALPTSEASPSTIVSPYLPPSPSSLMDLHSVQSDFSPSPSVASVRMAQVVSRQPPTRQIPSAPLDTLSRLSVDTSISSSTSFATTETEEEGTVFDASRLVIRDGPPTVIPLIKVPSTRAAAVEAVPAAPTSAVVEPSPKSPVESVKLNAAALAHQDKGKGTMSKSASNDSVSSWRENLDATVREMNLSNEPDPAIRPEADAMQRMKSILGPKMKIISKAPWDADGSDSSPPLESSTTSIKSSRRSSEAASHRAGAPSTSSQVVPPSKENVKPKTSRTRSFSVLASRRNQAPELDKASEEAYKGLGLGLGVSGLGDSPTKSSFKSFLRSNPTPVASTEPLNFGDKTAGSSVASTSAPVRKQSAPAEFTSFAFPSTSSNSSSSSPTQLKTLKSSTRSRPVPPPVMVDMAKSASLTAPGPSTPDHQPKSAPPNMAYFSTIDTGVPRSESGSSLTVRVPPILRSSSSNLSSTTGSTPTTPTGATYLPPSPTSPTGSTPTGYKLISLEEARQRESDRIATALAQRKAAKTPVEHIAGRDDVLYGTGNSRTRESTGESNSSRGAPALPPAVPVPISSHSSSPSTSTTASVAPAKSLKTKKSGFLKRMMGHDKHASAVPELPSAPLVESFRPLPNDFTPSASAFSVTVSSSSPHQSVDLGKNATIKPSSTMNTLASVPSSNHISFLATPTPDPDQRLRKGLAPSLSLRPISMAFSAGLPSDFLANAEAALASGASGAASVPPPSNSWIAPTSSSGLTSPTESLATNSPFAASFSSSTSGGANSSLFDNDSESLATTSTAATPLTPGFPSPALVDLAHSPSAGIKSAATMTSKPVASETYGSLLDQFAKAKKTWEAQKWALEEEVKMLRAELEQVKSEGVDECERCGSGGKGGLSPGGSVLERPRFKGHGGGGALYGSGLAV